MLLDVFENVDRVYGPAPTLFWIEPTETTPGYAAGYCGVLPDCALLPAAATTMTWWVIA